MILEVENLSAGYGRLRVLQDICMKVEQSEITCIIGPNGSGKSTLLKTIFGLTKIYEGKIVFEGQNISRLRPDTLIKKGISYVLQGRSVFPSLTVLENLALGTYVTKDTERTPEILRRFPRLQERRNQKAGTLSGGEQRMLELARAMLLNPKLILVDEPSLGLAPKISKMVYDRLVQMTEEGITVLLVEQNVRKALDISKTVYVIELGHIAFSGPTEYYKQRTEIEKVYLGEIRQD